MSIGSIVSKDVGQGLASVADKAGSAGVRTADQASHGILQDAHPLLKLVLGKDWADFLTKPRLPQNAQDQGPRWLTAITSRLDGQQRQGVGLAIRGNASLPTPVPGLTLTASDTTSATLRRNPAGNLQLLYSTQLDGGVAAQIRAGLTGGVEVGHFGLQVQAIAQAGVGAQGAENSLLTYEINPKNAQDMTQLASQLQGHLVVDDVASHLKAGAQAVVRWGKEIFLGEAPAPATSPAAMTFSDAFARQHLTQASFDREIRLNAGANLALGVGANPAGKLGVGGEADLMGNTYKMPQPGQAASRPGGWQNLGGDGIGLLSGLVTPNVGAGATYNVGLEHTLDFTSGKYLRTTQALTSDRSLFANEGGFAMGMGQLSSSGRRYAVTVSPAGLLGVDRSAASTVKSGLKDKAQLAAQFRQSLDNVLVNNKANGNDVLLATYTLKDAELAQLKALPSAQLQAKLPQVFAQPDAFQLARLVREHGDNFNLGGSFGIGAGLFTGGGINVDGNLSTQAVDSTGKALVDKPSPDSAWIQG